MISVWKFVLILSLEWKSEGLMDSDIAVIMRGLFNCVVNWNTEWNCLSWKI